MASIISAGTTSGTALNMAGDTSGVLQLATNGSTTAVTVDASQKVGIGITSPATKLHVYTGSATDTSTTIENTLGALKLNKYSDGSTSIETTGAYDQRFITNSSERMRIDSSGNILLGTTSTASFPFGGTLFVGDRGVTDCIQTYRNGTGAAGQIGFNNPNGRVGEIYTNGSSTVYATSSDYRLKENIVSMTGALDKVVQLKPVTYKWKIDGSDGQGFIAHELQAIIPDAVVGEKDAVDAEGKPVYQGVDTSFLVATLTAAIQEQQTIINDLKARITALEGAA